MANRKLPDYLPADWPDNAYIPTREDWDVAQEEDRIAKRAFAQMETPRSQSPTPESIAAGDAHMAEAQVRAAATVKRQIESKELLTADEFCDVLEVDVDWLDDALEECRVFAITGPGGRSYYPAFYAEPGIKREHVELVTRTLALLHPRSQYLFYTTARTSLGETPLDALRAGRLDDVITAALGATADTPPRVPSIVEVLGREAWPPKAAPRHDPGQSFADVLKGAKRR
jgi:hypothetical protein